LLLRNSGSVENVLKLQGVLREDSILLALELLSDGYLKSVVRLACDFTLWHDMTGRGELGRLTWEMKMTSAMGKT
jgi:hypothetical protein